MNTIDMMTYNRVSQINTMMNRFIREASIVKTQMTSSLMQKFPQTAGIGNFVDLFA